MRELEPGGPAAESRPAARCRGPSHGPAKGPACFPRNPACGDGRRRPGGVSSPAKSRAATGDDSERVRVPAADVVRARRCRRGRGFPGVRLGPRPSLQGGSVRIRPSLRPESEDGRAQFVAWAASVPAWAGNLCRGGCCSLSPRPLGLGETGKGGVQMGSAGSLVWPWLVGRGALVTGLRPCETVDPGVLVKMDGENAKRKILIGPSSALCT